MIGLIGKKIGMTQVFDDAGRLVPVTVVAVEPNKVIGRKTADKDGYDAIVLGYREMKKIRITKPYAGQFAEGIAPSKMIRELRDFTGEAEIGADLGVTLFEGVPVCRCVRRQQGQGLPGRDQALGLRGRPQYARFEVPQGAWFHRAADVPAQDVQEQEDAWPHGS
jgi:large subunit ribosomal protein L3